EAAAERRFARSGLANEPHHAAARDGKAHVLERVHVARARLKRFGEPLDREKDVPRLDRARHYSSPALMQRDRCFAPTRSRCTVFAQAGIAWAQRGAKAQPAGMS